MYFCAAKKLSFRFWEFLGEVYSLIGTGDRVFISFISPFTLSQHKIDPQQELEVDPSQLFYRKSVE